MRGFAKVQLPAVPEAAQGKPERTSLSLSIFTFEEEEQEKTKRKEPLSLPTVLLLCTSLPPSLITCFTGANYKRGIIDALASTLIVQSTRARLSLSPSKIFP